MNTCPTCQNDLVCHDQGECLRPTPETPDYGEPWALDSSDSFWNKVVDAAGKTVAGVVPTRRAVTCVNACAEMADPAAEIAKLREALDSFDATDKERNDALKVCMNLLETMHFNRRIFKVDAYTDEIEAAMAQIKTCYDPHAD